MTTAVVLAAALFGYRQFAAVAAPAGYLDLNINLGATALPRQPGLTLRYGAVMHQVRSHAATVYLRQGTGTPVGIGLIRPDPRSGLTPPLHLVVLP